MDRWPRALWLPRATSCRLLPHAQPRHASDVSMHGPPCTQLRLERSTPSRARLRALLAGRKAIGEVLLHVATDGGCEHEQRVARQRQLECKLQIWQGRAGMLGRVEGLSGAGSAGSQHARTIMWLRVAMRRRRREPLGTDCPRASAETGPFSGKTRGGGAPSSWRTANILGLRRSWIQLYS